jgi:hypothetical protein
MDFYHEEELAVQSGAAFCARLRKTEGRPGFRSTVSYIILVTTRKVFLNNWYFVCGREMHPFVRRFRVTD